MEWVQSNTKVGVVLATKLVLRGRLELQGYSTLEMDTDFEYAQLVHTCSIFPIGMDRSKEGDPYYKLDMVLFGH
jgi:hypothetical protein